MSSQNIKLKPLNILVFGPTGVGKSTIINYLTSAKLPVGDTLESCTKQVEIASVEHKGRKINYFDTPGFDDSFLTSAEQLAQISSCASTIYKATGQAPNIHGVLYIHRITDNKVSGSTVQNLRVLEKLLGPQAFQNLVFVTNMWGAQPNPKHVQFEAQLMESHRYFASAIKQGARAGEKYRIREGTTEVQVRETLSDLFLSFAPVIIQIQHDMVDEKRALGDTDAGRIIGERVKNVKMNAKVSMEDLRNEFATLSGGEGERKKRIELQFEEAKNQFIQARKQEKVLEFTIQTIQEHPYLSTLVVMTAIGTAGLVAAALLSGDPASIAKLAGLVAGFVVRLPGTKPGP